MHRQGRRRHHASSARASGACITYRAVSPFIENIYDHEIYEHAHRLFCSRLQSAGLRGDEAVEAELASSNLCGALDFSKVDDVCGRLETPERLMKKAAHDARCAHRGPGAQPRVADESIGGLFSRLRGA